jgi:hypothetical protein
MSYLRGADLQEAIFQHLQEVAELGAPVHDEAPPGTPRGTYVVLGAEEVIDRSDISGPGAEHRFSVTIVSDAAGFSLAKRIASRVSEALDDPPLTLSKGRLVGICFYQAQARRIEGGKGRRIELRYRARIEE